MKAGEFPNGARVLRAKIDMASGNINLRDPVLYRILHATASAHRRQMVHLSELRLRARPVGRDRGHHALDLHAGIRGPPAALRLAARQPAGAVAAAAVRVRAAQPDLHVLSKRVLTELVRGGHVAGWDDPRMPTSPGCAARRAAGGDPRIRQAHRRAKANSVVDVGMLEFCIREVLNRTALRRMAVLRPLKVVIENYPEGQVEELEASTIRTIRRPARARSVRPRALHRARRFHGEPAEEVLPAVAGHARCGCATPISSPAARW
jgi:glutaminyl-tRNA synthetase